MGKVAQTKEIPADVTVTYQLQYRKCGKSTCTTCRQSESKGHGPYWYGYWHEKGERLQRGQRHKQGRLHTIYFGKTHPDVAQLAEQIEQQAVNVV
jgi:hypothetical protein